MTPGRLAAIGAALILAGTWCGVAAGRPVETLTDAALVAAGCLAAVVLPFLIRALAVEWQAAGTDTDTDPATPDTAPTDPGTDADLEA